MFSPPAATEGDGGAPPPFAMNPQQQEQRLEIEEPPPPNADPGTQPTPSNEDDFGKPLDASNAARRLLSANSSNLESGASGASSGALPPAAGGGSLFERIRAQREAQAAAAAQGGGPPQQPVGADGTMTAPAPAPSNSSYSPVPPAEETAPAGAPMGGQQDNYSYASPAMPPQYNPEPSSSNGGYYGDGSSGGAGSTAMNMALSAWGALSGAAATGFQVAVKAAKGASANSGSGQYASDSLLSGDVDPGAPVERGGYARVTPGAGDDVAAGGGEQQQQQQEEYSMIGYFKTFASDIWGMVERSSLIAKLCLAVFGLWLLWKITGLFFD